MLQSETKCGSRGRGIKMLPFKQLIYSKVSPKALTAEQSTSWADYAFAERQQSAKSDSKKK